MVSITCVILCYWFTSCIFHADIAAWIFLCNLRQLLIDKISFLLITHFWIKIENRNHLRIAIFRCKFPCYLYDGTMNLDTKEILWLSRNTYSCLERDRSIDIPHGSSTNEC